MSSSTRSPLKRLKIHGPKPTFLIDKAVKAKQTTASTCLLLCIPSAKRVDSGEVITCFAGVALRESNPVSLHFKDCQNE